MQAKAMKQMLSSSFGTQDQQTQEFKSETRQHNSISA